MTDRKSPDPKGTNPLHALPHGRHTVMRGNHGKARRPGWRQDYTQDYTRYKDIRASPHRGDIMQRERCHTRWHRIY